MKDAIPIGHISGPFVRRDAPSQGPVTLEYVIHADRGETFPPDGRALPKKDYPLLYEVLRGFPQKWWQRLLRRPKVCVYGETEDEFSIPDMRVRMNVPFL